MVVRRLKKKVELRNTWRRKKIFFGVEKITFFLLEKKKIRGVLWELMAVESRVGSCRATKNKAGGGAGRRGSS